MELLNYQFTKVNGTVELRDFHNIDRFRLNEGKEFSNRALVCNEASAFLFDGYATWFEGNPAILQQAKDLTVTCIIAPLSYETVVSGLVSQYSIMDRKGFYIGVSKLGRVVVGFADGFGTVEYESIDNHLVKDMWNIVTVTFDCTAGWSTLFVNGVISNRKQFARGSRIVNTEIPCYVGKFVDGGRFDRAAKQGTYHGYIHSMVIDTKASSIQEVLEEHKAQRSRMDYFGSVNTVLDRTIYKEDFNRPRYHLIAPGKWMNEPHAPMYFNGYYHIFYQANQHAPLFDNLQWGHMVSTDMMHWRDLPLALQTQENSLDPDGCWSGSSCIDKDGIPTIFYTAGNNKSIPNQGVAIAEAVLDKNNQLEVWTKQNKLAVKQGIDDGWLGEFRDPYVWLEEDTYFMLVGTGDAGNGGGNAMLYTSKDKKTWTKEGFILEYSYEQNTEAGHVWELPVLLPVRNESNKIAFHVLLLCACQIENNIVHTYYWKGDWDAAGRRFTKHHEKALLLDLGAGVFTGPSGFVTPDKRSVVFTIAQGKRNHKDEFQSGWAHNGGLPVELHACGGRLGVRPICEVYQLRSELLLEDYDIEVDELNRKLAQITSSQLYIKLESKCDFIGIAVNRTEGTEEVFYDRAEKHFGVRTGTRPEEKKLVSVRRNECDFVDIGDQPIIMEYFLDNSMIEVYLNELKAISHRNYTEKNDRALQIVSKEEILIHHIQVWSMNAVYL